jgi:uncharacterized protein YggE
MEIKSLIKPFMVTILVVFVSLVAVWVFPFEDVDWGTVRMGQERTISVTGRAEMNVGNEVADFSAGVNVFNEDKEMAVDEVNRRMTDLVEKVKQFGIADEDIETQSVSVYEQADEEILIYPPRESKQGWQASNTIRITLRDVDRAGELTDLLAGAETSNVYGPNLRVDRDNVDTDSLQEMALEDAYDKANKLASRMGSSVGRVISLSESGVSSGDYGYGIMEARALSSSAPIEAGSSEVSASVYVVFELK